MSQELIYTSVPKGLKPGSRGFSTVAMTSGMSSSWVDRLESLSGYQPIYPLGDANTARNPVSFAHWRVTVAGKSRSVLSRVAFAGADYSQRSNKFAHHVVLEPGEQAAGGPAWMLRQRGVMRSSWSSEPQLLAAAPKLPSADRPASICSAWAAVAGDAGWGGALAESFVNSPSKPAYLIFEPGTDVLALIDEALALLEPKQRWNISFNTYFTELPLNLMCSWRAVAAGTPGAITAAKSGANALVIDLTKSLSAVGSSGGLVAAARVGGAAATVNGRGSQPGPIEAAESAGMSTTPEFQGGTRALDVPRARRRLGAGGVLVEETPDLDWLPEPLDNGSQGEFPPVRRSRWPIFCALVAMACAVVASGFVVLQLHNEVVDLNRQIARKDLEAAGDEQAKPDKAARDKLAPMQEKISDLNSQITTLNANLLAEKESTAAQTVRIKDLQQRESKLQEDKKLLLTQIDALKAGMTNSGNSAASQAASESTSGSGVNDILFAIDPAILEPQANSSGGEPKPTTSPLPEGIQAIAGLIWPNAEPIYVVNGTRLDWVQSDDGKGIAIRAIIKAQGSGDDIPHKLASISVTRDGQLSFIANVRDSSLQLELARTLDSVLEDGRKVLKYSVFKGATASDGERELAFRRDKIPGSLNKQLQLPFAGNPELSDAKVDPPWTIKPDPNVKGSWTVSVDPVAGSEFSFQVIIAEQSTGVMAFQPRFHDPKQTALSADTEFGEVWDCLKEGADSKLSRMDPTEKIGDLHLPYDDQKTIEKLVDAVQKWNNTHDDKGNSKTDKKHLDAISIELAELRPKVEAIKHRFDESAKACQLGNNVIDVHFQMKNGNLLDYSLQDN